MPFVHQRALPRLTGRVPPCTRQSTDCGAELGFRLTLGILEFILAYVALSGQRAYIPRPKGRGLYVRFW